ncbi:MAG TPA: glycosyltransferase family 2 protein [Sphingomicrobium sp.]
MLKKISSPEISVVIPCLNEEENAEAICSAVIAEMEKTGCSFELIFIDNCSTDRTVPIIRDICDRDARVKLIVNTRNFGQMRSPTHGIYQARGSAVINMCADFQDPPALIPEFVRRWQDGAKIVLGVRETEKSGAILTACRNASYALQRRFGDYPIIPNATGFGLYDAQVVRAVESLNEPEPFFRALLVETGFPIETIPFKRPPRAGGRTKNNFLSLLDFALSGLAASSKGLLRVPLYFGFVTLSVAFLSFIGALWTLYHGLSPLMWLFAALLELQFGLLFMFFGLVGVQIRAISDRTRGTPLVIERERVNFEGQ